jgi:hypothetical protein
MQHQQVAVSSEESGLGSGPDANANALTLRGADLDALADDSSTLQSELQAMSGPSPGTNGGQIYIDGFAGGNLPPKSAIREIRMNQNPYSAQYDKTGFGRIEVFTKPGTDKLHVDLMAGGNDSAFDSRNPFVQSEPPYHSTFFYGDISDSLKKKVSVFLNGGHGDFETNAIVNAETLDANLNEEAVTQAVASPRANTEFGSRIDFQPWTNQTVTLRYQYDQSKATNAGVGQFALPSQAYDSLNTGHVLQISDTQAYGRKVVNETRFQYARNRSAQTASSSDPTLSVEGAFTGGGSNSGNASDHRDQYEVEDYVSFDLGRHLVKYGGRLGITRDASDASAGFNGDFTFQSLSAYQTTRRGIDAGWTPGAIRAAGGGASQFTLSTGIPNTTVALADAGLYAEDNWKLRQELRLTYGLRFETQNHIHDHRDFAPRAGIMWGVDGGRGHAARTVLRAGYGWFFTRFGYQYVLQTERQNGVNQRDFIVNSPDFFPNIPAPASLSATVAPTIYNIDPNLHAPYVMQASAGMDRQFGKSTTLSLSYVNSHGLRQLLSRNINAPLPGTYNPADPASGIRPLGPDQNVYQHGSEGIFKQNQLIVNLRTRTGARVSIYSYYVFNSAKADTAGADCFPSNQYDIKVDYGRAGYDIRHRLFFGGSFSLPFQFQVSPFIMASSGVPFNIVVGQDLNGDGQFNDRPAFATVLTRPSVIETRWGTFDTEPMPGQRIIPINYGEGPAQFTANLRVGKTFGFGAESPGTSATPPSSKIGMDRRYSLSFNVSAQNVFNHVNLAQPVGTLGSPLFGISNGLAGSPSANRIINLQLSLRF